ncbi:MAG: hypothetical protein AAF050_24595, partial [Cyanobacteria bacterium J06649_5]
HANLRKIFEPITNTRDETEYEDLLVDDEALRDDFYERLSQFSKVFAIALSSERFITDTPERKINSYRQDLKRFQNLKAAVKLRCADDLDIRDLEPKIKKLLDTHISASEVTTLTGPVNIFDDSAFNSALDRQPTLRAKADRHHPKQHPARYHRQIRRRPRLLPKALRTAASRHRCLPRKAHLRTRIPSANRKRQKQPRLQP